jgi:hypothetical protein
MPLRKPITPLANVTAFNLQNYYIGEVTDSDESANQFWFRYAKPFSVADTQWLLRASLPINTFLVAGSLFDVLHAAGVRRRHWARPGASDVFWSRQVARRLTVSCTEPLKAALAIVENLDALLHGGLHFGPRGKPSMMDEFVLEAAPEALHRRVVVAVTLAQTSILGLQLHHRECPWPRTIA